MAQTITAIYNRKSINAQRHSHSHIIVVVEEIDIPRPTAVIRHEFTIPGGPLVARVGRKHALDAHADALDRLNGRPAGGT